MHGNGIVAPLEQTPFGKACGIAMELEGFSFIILLLGVVWASDNSSLTNERHLIGDLLSQRSEALGPNVRYVRPKKTEGPVDLRVTIRFQKLVELDAASEILTAKLWVYLQWTDDFMTWNPEDYGNITSAVWLAMDEIWMPDFTMKNALDSRTITNLYHGLYIRPDGRIVFVPIVMVSLPCTGDISIFPYDIHRCNISLGSWLYSANDVNTTNEPDRDSFLMFYQQNQQWSLELTSHSITSILDDCCSDDEYRTVNYHVIIKRNASFFFFALIFPGCLLNLLVTVMFILPPEFPDKVNIGVSIFLSHIVLIMVLVEVTPSNGPSLPVLGQFYCANTCMAVLSILASVVTYNMQARTSQVAEFSKKFLVRSARALGLKHQRGPKDGPEIDAPLTADGYWQLKARVVDRILLLTYTVTMVTCSLTILLQLRR